MGIKIQPEVYLRDDYLVLDFETTNIEKGTPSNKTNKVVLAVWKVGKAHPSFSVPKNESESRFLQSETGAPGIFCEFGSEFEQSRLLRDVARASFIVAHNAKFECGWLLRCGVELRDIIVWCTQIAEYNERSNRPGGLSLDATLTKYGFENKLSYVRALIHGGVCPSEITFRELAPYCVRDVVSTERVFFHQRQKFYKHGIKAPLRLQFGRCLQTPMLAEIEQRGTNLDEERVRTVLQNTGATFKGLTERFAGITGGINWNSPKQIAKFLYEDLEFSELRDFKGEPIRTAAGGRSTAEQTIGLLKATTDKQKEFKVLWLELAPLRKEITYLESFYNCTKEDGGVLYATYNQTVTATGRLSSTGGKWGIQFQNIPRHLKSLFRAREKGWQILDADCPQLEFRTATDLAHDVVASQDILRRSFDIHALTASVLGVSRQQAKPHTFKPLYGGSSGTPRMRKYYNAFRDRYSGIYRTQMDWVYFVVQNKYLSIPSGLRFYWPDTERLKSGYITNTPSIFNYPIQSFATADISQLSLWLVWHSLRGMDSFICNTVHDSGVFEVAQEELDKVKEIVVNCYTEEIYEVLKSLYDYSFTTPLGVGIKVGDYWGEAANEEKFENEERFQWAA